MTSLWFTCWLNHTLNFTRLTIKNYSAQSWKRLQSLTDINKDDIVVLKLVKVTKTQIPMLSEGQQSSSWRRLNGFLELIDQCVGSQTSSKGRGHGLSPRKKSVRTSRAMVYPCLKNWMIGPRVNCVNASDHILWIEKISHFKYITVQKSWITCHYILLGKQEISAAIYKNMKSKKKKKEKLEYSESGKNWTLLCSFLIISLSSCQE